MITSSASCIVVAVIVFIIKKLKAELHILYMAGE